MRHHASSPSVTFGRARDEEETTSQETDEQTLTFSLPRTMTGKSEHRETRALKQRAKNDRKGRANVRQVCPRSEVQLLSTFQGIESTLTVFL